MLHNFAFKNRLHHLCAAAIAIFSYLLSGDECKAVIKTLESKSPAITPSNGQYQTAGMFCQLSAQFNGLSQEIRSFFLAVLFPNPQFKIDEVSFCADICHNWCISVKTLVGTGYAFLIGFRIVKGGLHQYRQEQSRYPGLSALCAFHAACRHLPAGCLCAGVIFLTKLLFPSICPTNTRPLGVMSRSSLNSMCIFFIALPPPVF